jgi:hypothetical protein
MTADLLSYTGYIGKKGCFQTEPKPHKTNSNFHEDTLSQVGNVPCVALLRVVTIPAEAVVTSERVRRNRAGIFGLSHHRVLIPESDETDHPSNRPASNPKDRYSSLNR